MTTPAERPVLDVLTAVRLKTPLDAVGRRLAPNVERWLKPPVEMARLFADQPAAVAETAELAARCTFTLKDLGYRFPDFPVPGGGPQIAYLRALTEAGARERYRPVTEQVRRQRPLHRAGLLGFEDLQEAAAALEPGTSAAVIVWESRWAAPVAAALRRSGGQLVASGRIPVQAILAALDAVEGPD